MLDAMALLKTTASDMTIKQLKETNYAHILIWLDPDDAGKKGARKLFDRLNLLLPVSTHLQIISHDKEPKQLNPFDLGDEIARYI